MCKFDGYAIWDSQHVLRNASKYPSDWEAKVIDAPDNDQAAIALLSNLEVDRLKPPLAVVTPSGEWHEMPGDWYSEDRNSADWQQWGKTVEELYAKWPSAMLVVLNCHQ